MEAIYLNNFRIALPVAFPATRRPTPAHPIWSQAERPTSRSLFQNRPGKVCSNDTAQVGTGQVGTIQAFTR